MSATPTVVCPRCEKLISPPERLTNHFPACERRTLRVSAAARSNSARACVARPEACSIVSSSSHEMTPLPVSVRTDSLAERSEFELPVPVSKLPDDSIMLSFATSRRVVKRSHPGPIVLVSGLMVVAWMIAAH